MMMANKLTISRFTLALLLWFATPWLYGDEESIAGQQSPGFVVLSATAQNIEGTVHLDATFALRFGTTLEEALHSGVTLPLLIEIEALQQRDYLWSKTVAHAEQGYLLSFNAVTGQYLLYNRNTDTQQRLPSLSAVRAVLGNLNKFPLMGRTQLKEGRQYLARLRITVASDMLPVPLRLMSYVTSDWDIQSEWYQWPLKVR